MRELKTMRRFGTHPLFLCVLASAAGAVSVLLSEGWWLAFVSLALLFYALAELVHSWKQAFWYGFLYGMVVSTTGIWWFWYTLPLDFLPIPARLAAFAVFMAWIVVSFFLAFPIAFGCVAFWWLRKNRLRALLFALLWVIIEQARMWSFALLTWAPQSLFGAHFSIAALANGLAQNEYLLQLSAFGGLTLLSFFLALGAAFLAELARTDGKRKWSLLGAGIPLVALLCLPLAFPYRPGAPVRMLTVDLMSTNTVTLDNNTTFVDEDALKTLLAKTAQDGAHPNLVILPESVGLRTLYPSDAARAAALTALYGTNSETLVVNGDNILQPDGSYAVQMFYDSSTRGELASYSKLFLMPLGEYTPYIAGPAYATLHNPSVDTYLNTLATKIERGNNLVTVPYDGEVLGGLLCSDILSPELYHKLVSTYHATLLLNVANPAWFHYSRLLYARTLEMAKIQAVENRTYLLTSANHAPAFAIDPAGRTIAQTPWNVDAVLPLMLPVYRTGS